jgi:hypothetical protein
MGAYSGAISLRYSLSEASARLQDALETVYSVDPARLEAIAAPIWQNVHDRYKVVIP